MVFKRLYLGSTLFWKNAKYFTRNTLIAPHTGSGSTFVEGLGGVSLAMGENPNTIFRHSFIVSRAFLLSLLVMGQSFHEVWSAIHFEKCSMESVSNIGYIQFDQSQF